MKNSSHRILIWSEWKFIFVLIIKFFAASLMVGLAPVFELLINSINGGLHRFRLVLGVTLIYAIIMIVFLYFSMKYTYYYVQKSNAKLKEKLFNAYASMEYENFHSNDNSFYLSRITNDVEVVNNYYSLQIFGFCEQIFTFVAGFAFAVLINWILSLIMVAFCVIVFLTPFLFAKKIDKANLELSSKLSAYTEELQYSLACRDLFVAYNVCENYSGSLERTNQYVLKASNKTIFLQSLGQSLNSGVVIIFQIICTAFVIYLFMLGKVGAGAILSVTLLSSYIFNPLSGSADSIMAIKSSKSIRNLLKNELSTPLSNQRCVDIKKEIFIELNSISVVNEDRVLLDNISLKFEKGKKYLILGESGSGKTTLLRVLSRMIGINCGSARINDLDYSNLSWTELTKIFAYIDQDVKIINKSIKQNIDLASTNDSLLLNESLRFSLLYKPFFDRDINQDYYEISKKPLSGGEKQRIAIARAYYYTKDIYLLDEITQGLDKASEDKILSNFIELENKIVICVAHKLSKQVAQSFDAIIVLEKGKLLYDGKYKSIDCIDKFLRD